MVATMTNEKNNAIFNEEMKNQFLMDMIEKERISEETAVNYTRIFSLTYGHEFALDKDVSKFTLDEIEDILYGFKANNRNTIETYGRIISSYLNWAVKYDKIEENVMEGFRPETFEKYLTNEEIYFTDKQMRRWEDRCANYQDAVIMRLLFMGVGGKEMSEIRNLKKTDVDKKNKQLTLYSTLRVDKAGNPIKFTKRVIDIDDRTIELINGAISKQRYYKNNGEVKQTETNNIRPYTDLVKNDFVVRASITKTDNLTVPVDKFVIYRRITTIKDNLVGLDKFTAKFIQRSGMIYHAKQLMQDGEFSSDDMKIVADRFNIKSHHNLKGFLTVENILKTYPEK